MSQSTYDADGPYIVWLNYGYEGWQPRSYLNLADALTTAHSHDFIITKVVKLSSDENGKLKVEE